MSLELKIESLKARGELRAEERDRLLRALKATPEAEPARRGLSPLRIFLLGALLGAGISQLAWWVFGPLAF